MGKASMHMWFFELNKKNIKNYSYIINIVKIESNMLIKYYRGRVIDVTSKN